MFGRLGCWVENVNKFGSLEHLLERAHATGCTWLVIKAGDAYRNNQFRSDVLEKFLDQAHLLKINVLSYHVSRPEMWTAEVHLISSLFKDGVDGHCIVPSVGWHRRVNEAARFVDRIKSKIEGSVSYSLPVESVFDYPVEKFAKGLDKFMPRLSESESSLVSFSKMMEKMQKIDSSFINPIDSVIPVVSPMGPQQMTELMAHFSAVPISLSSGEKYLAQGTVMSSLLNELNARGLIAFEDNNVVDEQGEVLESD